MWAWPMLSSVQRRPLFRPLDFAGLGEDGQIKCCQPEGIKSQNPSSSLYKVMPNQCPTAINDLIITQAEQIFCPLNSCLLLFTYGVNYFLFSLFQSKC